MKLLSLILLLLAAAASAQDRSGRHALIIGVSKYKNPAAATLEGVPFDVISAGKIADAMGIPRANQTVLQDDGADKASVFRELDALGKRVSPGDRVLVYFSGHGTRWPDAQGKCLEGLYPYDGQAITHAEFAQKIATISKIADKLLTVVDACHSGGVVAAKTRSLRTGQLNAKFFAKADSGANQDCARPANFKARSLFDNVTRLGALQENTVEIAAALPDEQSWDDPRAGGLATQGIRDCLLGAAKDLDASGAVNLAEVQQCAQKFVNDRVALQPKEAGYLPHTITVLGNKNLIPVVVNKPPVQQVVLPEVVKPTVVASLPVVPSLPVVIAEPVKPEPVTPEPTKPPLAQEAKPELARPEPVRPSLGESPKPEPVKPESVRPEPVRLPLAQASKPEVKPEPVRPEAVKPESVRPPVAPVASPVPVPAPIASLATIKDVYAQRDPRFEVKAVAQSKIEIGKEELKLTVESKRDGYLYVVLLGSDRSSFYLLYPNAFDRQNKIKANQPLTLPAPNWEVKASGPAGTDELLVLVSASPRDLKALPQGEPTSAAPFTYSLNDLGGRATLIDFLTGRGVQGRSESFGASMLSVVEYEGKK